MTAECFMTWRQYIECNLSLLGYKYNIALDYGTRKQECLKDSLVFSHMMYNSIKCLAFYTEAEQEADSTLTTGDKTGCLTHEELITILYEIKRLITVCV